MSTAAPAIKGGPGPGAASSTGGHALSYNQLSMWLIHQDAPTSSAYNVAVSQHIPFELAVGPLRTALQALLDRHPMLRTTYDIGPEGLPVQHTAGFAAVAFTVHEVPGLTDDALRELLHADYSAPFNLQHGPVFRASLYTRGPADHVLLMVAHHIACDGLSSAILRDDLTALYVEAAQLAAAPLPPLERQYRDFAEWQRQLLADAEGARMAAEWLARLEGLKDFEVPGDRPRPAQKSYRGASVAATLDADLTAALRRLARDHGVTLYVLMLAAFDAMLFRLTGRQDLVVGTPTAGRNLPGVARVVGNFVNPIPLRTKIQPGMSFHSLLQRVRDDVRDGLGRQDYPLPLLVQNLRRRRDPGRSPLYETLFTFLTEERDPLAAQSDMHRLAPFPVNQLEGQFDLALQVIERGAILPVDLRFNPEIFDAVTASGLLAHYRQLLAAIVQQADLPLERLTAPSLGVDPLLATLGARGIRIVPDGDSLQLQAPPGKLDDALKAELQRQKSELVNVLGTSQHPPLRPRGNPQPALLSTVQQWLCWLEQVKPGSGGSIALQLQLQGRIDEQALARAVDAVMARHEALRMAIHEAAGSVQLRLPAMVPGNLRITDLSAHPADDRDAEVKRRVAAIHQTRFDPSQGPLALFDLIRLAPDSCQLHITLHPLAADHASLQVLWQDIAAAYAGERSGNRAALPSPDLQYPDYAAWQREGLQQGRFIQDLLYWTRQLHGAPDGLQLPLDHPRPEVRAAGFARHVDYLEPALLQQLTALGSRHGTALETILIAAWQVLLARRTGQPDIVVGSPVALRDDAATARMVGPLENVVALRGRLGDNPTVTELLQRTDTVRRHARAHGELPFDRMLAALDIDVAGNRHPVFQTMVALRQSPATEAGIEGLQVEASVEDETPAAGVFMDLTLEAQVTGRGLRLRYGYSADLFEQSTVERLHRQYAALLESMAGNADQPIRALSLLSAGERLRLDSVNRTMVATNRATLVEQFLAMAAEHRDRPAVSAGDGTLSYGEFAARSGALARQLRAAGVGRGDFVALATDRTTAMPLAAMGIMRAGAAYLPIDLSYPAERVALMLEDSGARHVVTTAALRDAVPARAGTTIIVLDEPPASPAATPGDEALPQPGDIAYLIYTSGSTGRPKGVLVPHSAVSNFLSAMSSSLHFGAADRILAVTSPSFDISVLEMFVPLVNGGCVIVASRDEVSDGGRLLQRLTGSGATLLQATPSGWRLLMQMDWQGDANLQAIVGGEPLPPALAAWLRPRVRTLWNAYGPTETTVWSTLARIEDDGPISVGRPIANTRIYVINPDGDVLPPGESGEIVIAGDGVTLGYHQRPELTAERFIAEPGHAAARMYRTGDIGRWREDGQLEHLGRLDDQVKLRGHRIELGEIEVRLAEHPAVAQAVVGVQSAAADDPRLAAWVRFGENADATVSELRRHLRRLLPDYMVPSLIVAVEAIPLAPNGKVDRRALLLGTQGRAPATAGGGPPSTPMQLLVAEVWMQLLGVPEVTLASGFFDLGGHSLLAMRAAHEIGQRIGRTVDPRLLFLRNLGQLADGLAGEPTATTEGAPVP